MTGTVDGCRITGPYIRLVRVTVASPKEEYSAIESGDIDLVYVKL